MHREVGLVKRAIILATAAFLAMLILAPMAMGQGTTVLAGGGGGGGSPSVSASPFSVPQGSVPQSLASGGGPALLLPAAALLLGSGILTYAILRRR
jgi:hypothetical protein